MALISMFERFSRWVSPLGKALTLGVCAMAVGCGSWEREAAYPEQTYVAPPLPTAEEMAAQQQAREIAIGVDETEYADTDPSALTEFKPALEGHGTWVDDAAYGTVWVPSKEEVGADFQPYVTAGHWTYSDATDYVWVSDYSWGWAPFHYGRWVYLSGHGWSWIPGRRYSGAWVAWRTGPTGYGYVGWAPAPPEYYWVSGVAIGWSFGFYHHHDYYVYCPHSYVYHDHVGGYVVRGPAAREHYGRTHDYVPAQPSVGDSDRVLARPSVGDGDRVIADPTVGDGRVVAKPGVGGPRPNELGIKQETVVAPPPSNQGLGRARELSLPATAIAAGAAPPSGSFRSNVVTAPVPPSHMASIPAPQQRAAFDYPRSSSASSGAPWTSSYRASTVPPPSVSHSAPDAVMRPVPRFAPPPSTPSPPVAVSRPNPFSSPSAPVTRTSPSFSSPSPVMRTSPSFSSPSPVMRTSPSFSSPAPVARSSPSFSSPVTRSSPSFSAPSRSSSPSFSAPSRAAPSIRSTPAPSFRSSAPSRPSRSTTRSFRR